MDNTIRYYNENAAEFAEGTINADMSQLYQLFQSYVLPGSGSWISAAAQAGIPGIS